MKFLMSIIAMLLITATTCNAQTATVPEWEWVENERITDDESSCGIEYGGTLTVIGSYDDSTYLVKYYRKGGGGGTECNNGAYFLYPKKKFKSLSMLFEERKCREQEKGAKILEILKNQ